MQVYMMPSLGMILYQLALLLVIGGLIYLWFLLVKALRIYIKNNSQK